VVPVDDVPDEPVPDDVPMFGHLCVDVDGLVVELDEGVVVADGVVVVDDAASRAA